jgi:hypothetical protein
MSKVKRIWKYEFPVLDLYVLQMPEGAKILTVQSKGDAAFIWALVNPDETVLKPRVLRVIGTGWEFTNSSKCKYLGTIQQKGGELIWHIFEELSK